MRRAFFSLPNSHAIAFIGAAAIHAAAVIPSMLNFAPTVINQQVIQVSFVAPNAAEQKKTSTEKQKISIDLKKENALKQKANEKNQEFAGAQKQSSAGKKTSGREDINAVATKSAESDPVFNAAYLNNPAPFYPVAAKRKGVQGKVLLSVIVKTDGTALSVAISNSSGSEILDEAALEAVKQWRFIPAKRGGTSVQASVIVPVEFKII